MTPPSAASARRTVSSSSADPQSEALAEAGRYTRSGGEEPAEPAGIGPDPESRRTLIGAVVSGLVGLVLTLAAATLL